MAVTKILAVTNRLDKRVAYVVNEQKTHLDASMTYITTPEKTEQSFFTSAINCRSVQTAFAEMMTTKRRFGKTDGVQAYHIIQSFAPGEVTPEQAHRIGLRFCEQLLENRYEVVIGTHLDKAHLHNHILVNSVARDNGAKYHSNRQSYYQQIRRLSDTLCREEQLSVIEPKGPGKHYAVWKAEQQGKPTYSQMIRADIDMMLRDSYSFPMLLSLLEKKGYQVSRNPNRKYLTVRPPGAKRNFRLDRLGPGYSVSELKARLLQQQQDMADGLVVPIPPPRRKFYRLHGTFHTVPKKKITGFFALYLRYIYLLRRYQAPTRKKLSYTLRREVLRLERYEVQFSYLRTHAITRMEQLEMRLAQLDAEIQQRTEQRRPLYDQRRYTHSEDHRAQLTEQIDCQSAALRALRKERTLCRQIIASVSEIEQSLSAHDAEKSHHKEVDPHEYRRRGR